MKFCQLTCGLSVSFTNQCQQHHEKLQHTGTRHLNIFLSPYTVLGNLRKKRRLALLYPLPCLISPNSLIVVHFALGAPSNVPPLIYLDLIYRPENTPANEDAPGATRNCNLLLLCILLPSTWCFSLYLRYSESVQHLVRVVCEVWAHSFLPINYSIGCLCRQGANQLPTRRCDQIETCPPWRGMGLRRNQRKGGWFIWCPLRMCTCSNHMCFSIFTGAY